MTFLSNIVSNKLRLGFIAMLVLTLQLTACQSTPAVKSAFNQRQIAALQGQGFRPADDGWELSFTDKLLFEFGISKLTPQSHSAVLKISHALQQVGIEHMRVEGHTDIEGSDFYNEKLSLARATTVADTLSMAGMPRNNIAVRGMGKSKPVASNATAGGRAENRRVTLIVSAP